MKLIALLSLPIPLENRWTSLENVYGPNSGDSNLFSPCWAWVPQKNFLYLRVTQPREKLVGVTMLSDGPCIPIRFWFPIAKRYLKFTSSGHNSRIEPDWNGEKSISALGAGRSNDSNLPESELLADPHQPNYLDFTRGARRWWLWQIPDLGSVRTLLFKMSLWRIYNAKMSSKRTIKKQTREWSRVNIANYRELISWKHHINRNYYSCQLKTADILWV